MSPLHEMAQLICNGLLRKSVANCADWTLRYRVMGKPIDGPWTFKHHPWLRDLHETRVEHLVAQKAAQMGLTEFAINRSFYAIDIERVNVLYVLPTTHPDATDFSTSRFDPALEMSEHIRDMFTDVKNIGHKRAGNANLFIRASRSRSQLKSIPASVVILDEIDEFDQDNIALVEERMSGQLSRFLFMLSTPTLPNRGINKFFTVSTQDHFMFKCPHCSRYIELVFPDSIVVTADNEFDAKILESHIICTLCKHKLDHKDKPAFLADGIWVPQFKDRLIRGVHINQLYSATEDPPKIARKILRARNDVLDEQELYNSKMGLPHVVPGAQVTDADIEAAKQDYTMSNTASPNHFVVMGVDVGTYLHYEIAVWRSIFSNSVDVNTSCHPYVVRVGTCTMFEELDELIRRFNVRFTVIDANPDKRKATELARRFPGMVKLCYYVVGTNTRDLRETNEDGVTVDRTSWLDLSLGRFKAHSIVLPRDIPREYTDHLKALVRQPRRNKDGSTSMVYEQIERHDHFAHARNYNEIALRLAAAIGKPQEIRSPL